MTPTALFIQSMIAVNIALPLAMTFGLKQVFGHWPRLTLFLICVIVLFSLNQYIAHRLPDFRKWVWGLQAFNLVSAVLLGTVGGTTAILTIWSILRHTF